MPFVSANGTRIFYRLEGSAGLPVLALSHSISTDLGMWEPQVHELMPHFQILRYDTRGHGASDTPTGEYRVRDLGSDFLGLLDSLKISSVAFCGLSLGGTIGQWLAINAPERLTALVLANTGARIGTTESWNSRITSVRQGGMAAIVDAIMPRFFSTDSLTKRKPHVQSVRSVFLGTDPLGYLGCAAALRDFDTTAELKTISTPTLVIGSDSDVSTPWTGCSEVLAREIPGARAIQLQTTHLSNLEKPHAFTAALGDFLLPGTSSDTLEAGFAVRRKVLGDAHVDRAIAGTTDFTCEFQDLITRYAWGTLWTRPGLNERTRRLLVMATAAALGRWEEFRLHISSALHDGMEPSEIKEVLLQTAIYAGVPAANTGFHIAQEEINKNTV
ncbi:MAG TPA: 3-oxoadipate enol-lactonase [Terriglobales bacterium]|jgi:3-oxoadipate enol-lactonase/4-carboxymuconolactone decarboxylase|nr:3-oxoadipate enol-lactonase [Terriglobales bacterium]